MDALVVRSVDVVRLRMVVVVFKKRVVFVNVNVVVIFGTLTPSVRRTMRCVVVASGGRVCGRPLSVSVSASVSVRRVNSVDVGKVGRVTRLKEVCRVRVVVDSRGVEEGVDSMGRVLTDDSGTELETVVRISGVELVAPMVVVIVVSMRGLELGITELDGINGVECTLELGTTELVGINGVELGATELDGINGVECTLELGATELEGINGVE